MVQKYLTKYQKIYQVLECPEEIDIPINDLDAWIKYPQYRFVYHKMELSRLQNILHAPMPIMPEQYPVVVRPMINLYCMGLESYLIKNEDDFYQHWGHYGFWTEYLTGNHYSYDLIIDKGEIKWYTIFQGHCLKDENGNTIHGAFDYWESIYHPLPDAIKKLTTLLDQYRGCLNVECIGDTVIEAHLRMGDIDQFAEKDILSNIIDLYAGKEWEYQDQPQKIYLIPVWGDIKLIQILKKKRKKIEKICDKILAYQIDTPGLSHPPGKTRVMNLTSFS